MKLTEILYEGAISDWVNAIKANAYATYGHRGQKRKFSGDAYVKHPRRVANRIKKAGIKDPDIIAAAYLHDVIEDTNITYQDIVKHFNKKVADIVKEVTNPPKSEMSKSAHFRQLFKSGSYGAIVIKTFDRIDNLSDGGSEDFLKRYKGTTDIIKKGLESRSDTGQLLRIFMRTYDKVYKQ